MLFYIDYELSVRVRTYACIDALFATGKQYSRVPLPVHRTPD
jgi:hypothetical protein